VIPSEDRQAEPGSQAETDVGSQVIPCVAVPDVAVMQTSYIWQDVSSWS
jgi:hypothetical protein